MGAKRYLKRVVKSILNKPTCQFSMKREYVIKNDELRFNGKVAVITGASGAIGGAIAWRLGYEGASVYLGGRNETKLSQVANQMLEHGINAKILKINVTDEKSIESAAKKVKKNEGKVNILVNCAGGSTRGNCADLIDQSVEMIDEMLNTNLRGSMLCTREFGKLMRQSGAGKIINIASVIGEHGKPKFSDYAASKAGIIGYTKSVAQEMGLMGITVNCVSPGFIQRDEFNEQQLPYLLKSNFMNKVGSSEDVAAAVAFLASNDADFITGQNLCVDGGRSLGLHGD